MSVNRQLVPLSSIVTWMVPDNLLELFPSISIIHIVKVYSPGAGGVSTSITPVNLPSVELFGGTVMVTSAPAEVVILIEATPLDTFLKENVPVMLKVAASSLMVTVVGLYTRFEITIAPVLTGDCGVSFLQL